MSLLSRIKSFECRRWLAAGALAVLFSLALVPSLAGAELKVPDFKPLTTAPNDVPGGVNTLVVQIANVMGAIIMGLSVIMILWAAFRFMTAGEDKDAVGKARLTLIYALVGVAVSLIAFFVPAAVAKFFGSGSGSI